MYLLDTDTLSGLMKRSPSSALLARFAVTSLRDRHTSSISIGELIYGALKSVDRREYLLGQIQRRALADVRVASFDRAAAGHYAGIRVDLERQGVRLDDADLRIAAVALARNLILVTGNVRHFRRVPDLRIENWLQ
jgi:predicted nucleic acid-binding protein